MSASISEGVVDPPPPPPLAEMVKDTFVVLEPPVPVAVTAAVEVAAVVGVPVMAPVVALRESPAGKPVAAHEFTGRLVASVSTGVCENATPTVPVKACPAVMIGTPAPTTKETDWFALVPPGPVARRSGAEVTMAVGVPVMAPVVALRESPAGNAPLAMAHEVAGRVLALVSAGVCENATPTLPVKDWPGVIVGGKTAAMVMVPVAWALVPPIPVAVKVMLPVNGSRGVPVIRPADALKVAHDGSAVHVHEVAGRLTESSNEARPIKAEPTKPVN